MSAVAYRYYFTDVLTGSVIGELSMTSVTFSQKLNTAGDFAGHILLSGINTTKLNVLASTIPGRCAVYVYRNGTIIWGGVIWSRNYDSNAQTLSLTAKEWLSYFGRRKITSTTVFTSTDQLQIAQTLINNAQGTAYGNVGCLINQDPLSTSTSGMTYTQSYYSYELKNVLTEIQNLSQQSGGFDYAIDCYDVGGVPTKSFNTYYPRRGVAYSSTNSSAPVFELPAGNIVSYTWSEDGSTAANTIYETGAGSNEGKLIATSSDSTKYAAGWPLLEDSASNTTITDSGILGNLATGFLNSVTNPPVTLSIVANPSQSPVLGSYRVGDDVRVRIIDPFFPNQEDATFRIMGLAVTAGEKQAEQVKLTLAQSGTTI